MTRPVEDLVTRIGGDPTHRPELWRQALTHPSAEGQPHYERLEFLGDAVLKLIVSEWLFERFGTASEGTMTKVRARAVSDATLARAARELDLGPHLILGTAEKRSAGREKVGILASSFEALLAAVYLAKGHAAAAAFLEQWLGDEFAQSVELAGQDNAKGYLQEWAQGLRKTLPRYAIVGEAGPEHERTYTAEVWVGPDRLGVGQGPTKKAAEQAAAAVAVATIGPAGREDA